MQRIWLKVVVVYLGLSTLGATAAWSAKRPVSTAEAEADYVGATFIEWYKRY